jgi:hypothetical protein
MLDPDPDEMNADPQPCQKMYQPEAEKRNNTTEDWNLAATALRSGIGKAHISLFKKTYYWKILSSAGKKSFLTFMLMQKFPYLTGLVIKSLRVTYGGINHSHTQKDIRLVAEKQARKNGLNSLQRKKTTKGNNPGTAFYFWSFFL